MFIRIKSLNTTDFIAHFLHTVKPRYWNTSWSAANVFQNRDDLCYKNSCLQQKYSKTEYHSKIKVLLVLLYLFIFLNFRWSYSLSQRFWLCLWNGISFKTSWRVFVSTTQWPCRIVSKKRINSGNQVSSFAIYKAASILILTYHKKT